MRIPGPSRRLTSRLARMFPLMSPNQPRAFRLAWWAPVDWSTRNAVGHDPTVQQPAAETRSGGSGEEYSDHRPRWWRRPGVGDIGGALTYPPACLARAGPEVVATLDVMQPPVGLVQHQALSAPQPTATAHGPAPATRVRVVLLPHARTEPTDTRTNTIHAHPDSATNLAPTDS